VHFDVFRTNKCTCSTTINWDSTVVMLDYAPPKFEVFCCGLIYTVHMSSNKMMHVLHRGLASADSGDNDADGEFSLGLVPHQVGM